MRLACDTGGTFTDLVVEDDDGQLSMYKASTVPSDPVQGVLAACGRAADAFGQSREEFLGRCDTLIHGTTHAINAIVTGRTAKTALLVTQGHPDILVLREGGRTEPFDFSVRFPDSMIPRALTFEVPERILADGSVRTALDEDAVRVVAQTLKERGVEAIAVCLIWSVVNGAHERRVREILAEEAPGIPMTLSHELVSSLREYRRCVATSIDASLRPLMTRYIAGIDSAMKDAGFSGQLYVLTSEGNMVDAREVAASPILAINSGPSMAPIGGASVASDETDEDDVIIFDTGGTTFDVSLVRSGRVPMTQETWLGRPFGSDMTGFPSVDVKSIGSGGGSIAWVDEGGMLHMGPQSAGSVPGPVCYGKGGEKPTVTDASLVLGHIDPDFFLGGLMSLNKDAAEAAIRRYVAEPLGVSVERAASAMLDVWTENMVQAINEITVNQGIDPSTSAIVGGGGAAGMNAVKIAARLKSSTLIIPETGAALSAYGAIVSDVGRNIRQLCVADTKDMDVARIASVIADIEKQAQAFASSVSGAMGSPKLDWYVEARYPHQVWEIDVPFYPAQLCGDSGAAYLEAAFHNVHESVFGYRDTSAHIEMIAWRVAVSARVSDLTERRLVNIGGAEASDVYRQAYFKQTGWTQTPVLSFGKLEDGVNALGPALIESAFTTVVVDPGARYWRTPTGHLIVKPGGPAQQQGGQ
ncbi:MAG: hydantoinase/oxoprolinase family protein [Pseudomonadota bacterium]